VASSPGAFNVPTSTEARPDERAHTIFDRTLLRAGETVSMKHVLRAETRQGFALPTARPDTLVITHVGSGQQFTQPLAWRNTATGGLSAQSSFAVPPAAKLGVYQVELRNDASTEGGYGSGEFRVEEFRLPVLQGRIAPSDKKAWCMCARCPPMCRSTTWPVAERPTCRCACRPWCAAKPALQRLRAFSFSPPRKREHANARSDDEEATASQDARVVADKLPLTLDRSGAGKLTIDNVPQARQPQELLLEATYADPNGEVQTIRSTQTLWPAAVVAGIKTEGWVSARQKMRFQALALQHDGKAAPDTSLQVQAIARITTTTRKRMVGGFYSYDNQTETKDLGTVCTGKSDSRGLLLCEARLDEAGEVELVATATDPVGNTSESAASVWVTRQGELWFGGEDHDRIDLLPEKKSYQPGETARFQVRMPFRFATALVAVEREGIIDTQVVQLNGQDPTVSLKVQPDWGPNVYVSVLALRGRLREVPWYSFFTWGFKAPREWWTSFWYEGKEYQAPTALVDLSKPAFRVGLAEIRVGTQAHQIDVKVTADKETYAVRGKAQVTITAKLPGGKPAAHAEVALAAVDQALLELMPNTSWNLLEAMLQRRSWGVETSPHRWRSSAAATMAKRPCPQAAAGAGRRRASCSTPCCCGSPRSSSMPTARPR
jgi:Large extracellular alpha-helical protein